MNPTSAPKLFSRNQITFMRSPFAETFLVRIVTHEAKEKLPEFGSEGLATFQ
jgi:hypothetical protein